MGPKFATTVRIARCQHGRVARSQLVAAGVDGEQIKRWLRDGRLRPVHHGVYAVGHDAPSALAELMAAVLACGEGAVVSHRSAARLLGLVPGKPDAPEITVPTTAGRRRPGVVVHRVRGLHPLDVAQLGGIPITTVPRVLLDLAPALPSRVLTRLCHESWVRHGTGPHHVEACIARNPHKNGVGMLRRALGADVTLSVLEDGFLALVRRHRLPPPRTNIDLEGDKVDCHWPASNLTVELLSYRFHASRRAFEADVARRRRSNHLAFTYGDVFERATATATELARRLAASAA